MKNINEQIERIKQLFTEERLHGNLVDDENTIEEQDMWKRGRKASEMTKDAERKRDSFRSDEEEEEFKKEFKKEAERIERFYKKDRKAFKRKYTYIEPNEYGDYKLFSHKDGIGDGKTIKLVKFPKGEKSTDFNIKQAKGLLVKYLDKKLNLKEGSYEIKQLHPKKDVDNSSYVVFSYIPNAIPSKGKSKTSAAKKSTPKSSDSKSDDKSNDKVPVKTNDITVDDTDARNIQVKSEKNDSLTSIDMDDDDIKTMKKRFNIKKIDGVAHDLDKGIMTITDGDGKEHTLTMNERKLTKKSLLEMTNTFDINTMLLEQFKDNDGNAINFSFADQLKKPSEEKVEKPTSVTKKEKEEKVTDEPNDDDITKKWKSKGFNCVINNENRESLTKDGAVMIAKLKFKLDGTYENISNPNTEEYGESGTFFCSDEGRLKYTKKDGVKKDDPKGNTKKDDPKGNTKKDDPKGNTKKDEDKVDLDGDTNIVFDHIGTTWSVVSEDDMLEVLAILEKYERLGKLCDFVEEYNLIDSDGIMDSLSDVGASMELQSRLLKAREKAKKIVKKCLI
jgi:hypothetical protein